MSQADYVARATDLGAGEHIDGLIVRRRDATATNFAVSYHVCLETMITTAVERDGVQ